MSSVESSNRSGRHGGGPVVVESLERRDLFSLSPITATPVNVAVTEGQALQQAVVARFTQPLSLGVLNTFVSSIDWGDGSVATPGVIVSDAAGGFDVIGSHQYTHAGTLPVHVSIASVLTGDAAAVTGDAVVTNAALGGTGATMAVTAGTVVTGGKVFTFTDANPSASASDFTATINWGGVTTSGAVVNNGDGTFSVLGTRPMARVGTFPVTVNVTGAGGGTVSGTATFHVADAKTTLTPLTVRLRRYRSSTQTVATFTSANPWSLPTDFTAEIFVGRRNHRGALARIASLGHNKYAVSGTFRFLTTGTATLRVLVTGKGGAVSTIFSTLVIRR